MEDENIKAATAMGTRRPRQGEAFWGEMVTAWKATKEETQSYAENI